MRKPGDEKCHSLPATSVQALRALAAALLLALSSAALADELSFDRGWQLLQGAEIVRHDGAQALRFESGSATHPGVLFEDGTIELEMMMSGYRAFVYLQFRRDQEGRGYEEIYFRSHKTRAPDALQYTPIDNRISAWQLYHGDGKTAPVELPADEWIPLKLVVQGSKAAVFVGETDTASEPDLVIARLAREPAAGSIAVRGFIAPGSEAPYSALFRNVRVARDRVDFDFSKVAAPPPAPAGTIPHWRLSESFEPRSLTVASLEEVPSASRRTVATVAPDREGLVNIGRAIERPPQARSWATLASVTIEAESAGWRRLDLGYSDAATVFLNGELLFAADDSYSYDLPRRQGLIGLFQAAVYLPLKKGENELEIVVADRFGGWGLMGRIAGEGITVKP